MEKPLNEQNYSDIDRRTPRPRIAIKRSTPAIKDDLEFTNNRCSEHARKISSIKQNTEIEIWFDKHYHNRYQHGDNNGKREGIDSDVVKKLVEKSVKHLLFYSSYFAGFTFLNRDPANVRATRIVLKEDIKGTFLNVVIEAHLIDLVVYEITVKTAMCTDSFILSDGQFSVEIYEGGSTLYKMEKKSVRKIYEF